MAQHAYYIRFEPQRKPRIVYASSINEVKARVKRYFDWNVPWRHFIWRAKELEKE